MAKLKIFYIFLFFLLAFSVYGACDLASKDFYCVCSGGYPCSSEYCPVGECDGALCGAKEYYTFTGSCFAYGSAGYCQIDDCNECDYQCNDNTGCYGNCCDSAQCPADYNYCGTSTYIYTRDYSCSSYYCGYSNIPSTDCGYTGAYGNNFCASSYSVKERDVGVCLTALGVPYCDTEVESNYQFCTYGCASGIADVEYQYKCAGTVADYSLQERDIYGYCRVENSETFSNVGTGLICSNWCENDKIVKTHSYELPSPCVTFSPSLVANNSVYQVVQNVSLGFKAQSAQTYIPDRVCFDELNDGTIDACYGAGYSGNWNDYYYVNTENIGTRYIKAIMYNVANGWIKTQTLSYKISTAFTNAEIQLVSGADESYYSNKSVNIVLTGQTSTTSGTFLSKCWSSIDGGRLCYGNVDNCNIYCPTYIHSNNNIDTNYILTSATGKSETVYLIAYSTIGSATDYVNVCFNDFDTGFFCGSCFDGLQNQNETGVDIGGVCGNCFNSFQDTASGETYIDYGGRCGTCFDNIKQDFETDVDWGGLCGNCSNDKQSDYLWKIGHETDKTIPFDNVYCETKSASILSSTILLIFGIITAGVIIFIIVLSALIFINIANITLIASFLSRFFNKNKK